MNNLDNNTSPEVIAQEKGHFEKDRTTLNRAVFKVASTMASAVISDQPLAVKGFDAIDSMRFMQELIHKQHVGWWTDLDTGELKQRNDGELLMLIVTELAEAMEGYRKNLMDDKLPYRKMVEVELADAMIRIFDYAGGRGYDLGGAIFEKLAFNLTREDHKLEARRGVNGKKV